MAEKEELVLRPGLSRWGWVLGFATLLSVFGAFGFYQGWPSWWLSLVGAAALFGFTGWVMCAERMRLRLSPDGFAYGTARRRYFFRWNEVSWFGVSKFAGHRWVVFGFSPEYLGDEGVRAINQQFGGFDRFLPDNYGMSALALAQLLQLWQQAYSDAWQRKPLDDSSFGLDN